MNQQPAPSPARGRPQMWLGILLCIAGPVIYAIQVANQSLSSPLYVPIMVTLGFLLASWSLVRRRTVWRWLAGGMTLVFAGLCWLVFASMWTPAYTGPATVGKAFPNFETRLASGEEFRAGNLKGDKNTVLLFYRGYW